MKSKFYNVPVGELLSVYGVVAEDVISKDGAVILPGGISLPALKETRPDMVSVLLRHGITHVRVKNQPQITAVEFRTAMGKLTPRIAEFNPMLAKLTVHQFAVIYANVDNKELREHGIRSLLGISKKVSDELSKASQITLSLIAENLDNEWEHSHSLNVALLSGHIARKLFPVWDDFIEFSIMGGLFHDIGKAFMPRSVQNTPELTPIEQRVLNCHPLLGETLLKDIGVTSQEILSAVRSHHEKWQGGGTPDGLEGDSIPMVARIVAVANEFENFASRAAKINERRCDKALSSVISNAQANFDHRVVRALLASIGLYPPGTVVQLSDSRVGVVLETKERNLVCPRILIWLDEKGQKVSPFEIVNITREGGIFIKDVLDDFSRRELDVYVQPEQPVSQKILARTATV